MTGLHERLICEIAVARARSAITRSYFRLWARAERPTSVSSPEHRSATHNLRRDAQDAARRTDGGRRDGADR
jgi:hypothetical protein